MSLLTTREQDSSAGGAERRKMRIRSGEAVIVSLAIKMAMSKTSGSLTMRFKSGGLTISRPVGLIEGTDRFELLKQGWAKVREEKIAEQNQWSWLVE